MTEPSALGPKFDEILEVMRKLKAERGKAHPCLACGRPTKTWKNLGWADGRIGPTCVTCRRLGKRDKQRSRWIRDIAKLGIADEPPRTT